MAIGEGVEVALAAKFQAVFPHLDERQRRLLAGAEARVLGHGGIRVVARAARMREGTVSDGVHELESGAEALGRVRRPGGGRKPLTQTDPGLLPALLALVQPTERGDPETVLRWTTRSTRDLARELTGAGHKIGADTVGELLAAEGFSLQGAAKTIEGTQHPDRDAQFRYIYEQATEYGTADQPVISVDTKKKELVGDFHNAGRSWRPAGDPIRVKDHDFPDQALGKAIPYGIYDLAANTGWVNVGIDHDTAAFAVESIRRWWNNVGADTYPTATRLLITADAGGSNSSRTRAFKTELAALAVETGLAITVCHFPPGTSKWNKIEHRLFSAITMNWRGRPLTSYEVVVNSIAATTTNTGLCVDAALDTNTYPTGTRIPDRQMNALPLTRHHWHGQWNYTLNPIEHPRQDPYKPTPLDQPSPHLAWLRHQGLTGLAANDFDALIATLAELHHTQHEADLDKRRGHPRKTSQSTGHHTGLTLADRYLATMLYQRHQLTQGAIADLFGVHPVTINRHTAEIRRLLQAAGHQITPAGDHPTTLNDLHQLATDTDT
ncbi:ISAzo13 family transposase, partial [Catenulispora pinistramenti]|uniref:ISAzo13 family transposase n=1 Tax=Catenulispora pinistramenti TaxID=2705254 RepID=UPI001E4D5E67